MAGGNNVTFLSNGTGSGLEKAWGGGKMMLMAEATWGGGSVKLQILSLHGTWLDVKDSTLSANGTLNLDLPNGSYRAVATTATAAYVNGVFIPTHPY